jgi:cytochrome c553
MSVIAKPLSDAEIDDLAAWYASIQISVRIKWANAERSVDVWPYSD